MNYLSDAEVWKPIPGYEGLYDASNLGRIRSHPGKMRGNGTRTMFEQKSKVMAQRHAGKRGDWYICLYKYGKIHSYQVARLVASAWHGVPKDGMTVNHINGNFLDNRAENLEWCTRSENIKHAFRTGLMASRSTETVLVCESGEKIVFPTTAEASRYLGRCRSYIRSFAKRGKNVCWSTDGTEYKFVLGGEA